MAVYRSKAGTCTRWARDILCQKSTEAINDHWGLAKRTQEPTWRRGVRWPKMRHFGQKNLDVMTVMDWNTLNIFLKNQKRFYDQVHNDLVTNSKEERIKEYVKWNQRDANPKYVIFPQNEWPSCFNKLMVYLKGGGRAELLWIKES